MNQDTRKIVKMFAIGFGVMVALALLYRAWVYFCPPKTVLRMTTSELLAQAAEKRGVTLLQKPLESWTEHDKKSEPRIHAWLEAHTKTILPWEWTNEGRQKDPDGYRRLWVGLFKEQKKALATRLDAERKKLKSVDAEMSTTETIHAHRTNQIEVIKAYVASNSFPMKVKVERLSKGRFWGWNTDSEEILFTRIEDIDGGDETLLAVEKKAAAQEELTLGEERSAKARLEARIEELKDLVARCEAMADRAAPEDDIFMVELCNMLNALEGHDR